VVKSPKELEEGYIESHPPKAAKAPLCLAGSKIHNTTCWKDHGSKQNMQYVGGSQQSWPKGALQQTTI